MREEGGEIAAELRGELVRLQRQYRLLEDDRNTYRNETVLTLQRQRRMIKRLMREEKELMKDVNMVTQKRNVIADNKTMKELQCMLKAEDEVKSAIEDENSKICTSQVDLKNHERKVEKLWKCACFDKTDDERAKVALKRVRTLENRLEQSTLQYDKTLGRNFSHRQDIESIAIQHKRFADLYTKLNKAYLDGLKEKDGLVDSMKALFTSREEAEHRIRFLKDKAARDLASFNTDFKDTMRILDHDRRLRAFMTTKEFDLAAFFHETIQTRREKRASKNLKVLTNEVEFYDETFKRLVGVSGVEDVDEMVRQFIAKEDANFALFNFVNDQGMARKQMRAEIEALKKEIVTLGNLNKTMTSERKKILAELEEKFSKVSQVRKANTKEDKFARKILDGLKSKIWSMFHRVNCTLFGISEISEENMSQFLGVVEKKANELLHIKLVLAIKESNEHEIAILHAVWTGQQNKPSKTVISPPSDFPPETLDSATDLPAPEALPTSLSSTKPLQDGEAIGSALNLPSG